MQFLCHPGYTLCTLGRKRAIRNFLKTVVRHLQLMCVIKLFDYLEIMSSGSADMADEWTTTVLENPLK